MGLFSSKKKISVSSVTYNLAGSEDDRVQFLPTAIAGAVIVGNGGSLGEAINRSLLGGPGIKMRSFGRWARNSGYNSYLQMDTSQLIVGNTVNTSVIETQIPKAPNQLAAIQTAEVGGADYGFWADQWMLQNYPARVNEDYEIDFNEQTNTVFISFVSGEILSFNPVGFDPRGLYLYVSYNLTDDPVSGPLVPGPTTIVGSPADYPSTSGWTNKGTVSTPGTIDLEKKVRTLITYSDDRPAEESEEITTSVGSYVAIDTEFEKKNFLGQAPGAVDRLLAEYLYQHNMSTGIKVTNTSSTGSEEEIEDGVIKTTVITTSTDSVGTQYFYHIDRQEVIEKSWSPMIVMIYQKGTGNPTLDAMFGVGGNAGAFFPFVPIRLFNNFISPTYRPEAYDWAVKAMKKAGSTGFDKFVTSISDNPSLGDIDHTFAVYGVSLNTKENASLKYVYLFFQEIMRQGAGGADDYNNWSIAWSVANNSALAWESWKNAQSDSANPLFGTTEPARIPYPATPTKKLWVRAQNFEYNMYIVWDSIVESTHAGIGKPGARRGDLWWTQEATVTRQEFMYGGKNGDGLGTRDIVTEFVSLHWQDSKNTYRKLSITGMRHINIVYGGKGVDIFPKDALNDTEESGFIVPLHEEIVRKMSLKDSTQMTTACTYAVFNCYTVTKQRWYQKSWFKIVIIIAAIVITVVTMGSGAPASAGLLGTAATVGAALGFAGTVAIIVGTIANALAAMILTQIITTASAKIFGDKVGAIVGAIASIAAVSYGTSLSNGTSFAATVGPLSSAQNILKLTIAAGDGYTGYMQAANQEIIGEARKLMSDFENVSDQIVKAYAENLGGSNMGINPLDLTDPTGGFTAETANMFLSRTLMSGSDIADMSFDLVNNFAAITLSTDLPV